MNNNENLVFFNFRHEASPYVLPAYVNGRKTKKGALLEGKSNLSYNLIDICNLDLLKVSNYINITKEEVTSKAIKEAIAFTSFNSSLNSFLEANLEEAILNCLEDNSFIHFKEAKVLEGLDKPYAKYLLANLDNTTLEGIYNLASKDKEAFLNSNFNSLYAIFIPKASLKALDLAYLAYKNDLNLKTKPSKLNYINNRFNKKEKALALSSLLEDNINNLIIFHEKDLEEVTSKISLEEEELNYLEAFKEASKVNKYSFKFKAIASKLEKAKASSSIDNKTIKEALTTKEAIAYYKELNSKANYTSLEKRIIKASKVTYTSLEEEALKEALASKDYLEAKEVLEEASFYNIKLLIEALEEAKEELEEKDLEEEEAKKELASINSLLEEAYYLEEVLEEEDNSFSNSNTNIIDYLEKEEVTSFKYNNFKNYKTTLEEAKAKVKAIELLEEAKAKAKVIEEAIKTILKTSLANKEDIAIIKAKAKVKAIEKEANFKANFIIEKAIISNTSKKEAKEFLEAKALLEFLAINLAKEEKEKELASNLALGKSNYLAFLEAKTKAKKELAKAKANKTSFKEYTKAKALALELKAKHLNLLEAYKQLEKELEALASKTSSLLEAKTKSKAKASSSKKVKAKASSFKEVKAKASKKEVKLTKEEKALEVFKLMFLALEEASKYYSFYKEVINTNLTFKEVLALRYKSLAKK